MERTINVVLPVYNEGESIYNLLRKYNDLTTELKLKVLVVDDCSKDDSDAWIKRSVEDFPSLSINSLRHEINLGLQGALKTGFESVSLVPGDLLVTMDGDNTHNPYLLRGMCQKVDEGADIVIASRYCEQSRIAGLSGFRKLLSYGARLLYSMIWRIDGVKDYTCLFRMYRAETVMEFKNRYRDRLIEEKGFTCVPEVLRKMATPGTVVVEVPMILVYSDKLSASNMKIMKTVLQTLRVMSK